MGFKYNPFTSNFDIVNPAAWTTDTKANILASTPGSTKGAFASDTFEFFVWDGTTWNQASLELSPITSAPDLGYEKNSDRLGYYNDAITDKYLYNTVLQGNARTENGAIRINVANTPDTFEIYLRGAWYTILYDFTTANSDLRHTPIDQQIYVWRGDSVEVGLNGQPVIQEYQVSMGAYPPYKSISCGTF